MQEDTRTTERARLIVAALGALLVILVLLLGPAVARATVLERMDTPSISRRATRILVGTVTSTVAETYAGGVRTAVHMTVTDPLKGGGTGSAVFYVPGGTLPDGRTLVVDGMATFTTGETAAVFIDRLGWVVGGYQGKVAVSAGRIRATGQSLALFAGAVKALAGSSKSAGLPEGITDPLTAEPQAASDAAAGTPVVSSVTPGTMAAGIGGTITINGTGFGAARGTVSFFYQAGQPRMNATVIDSWTDTQIVCEVPIGTINGYAGSAGSGPVVVRTAAGVSSSASAPAANLLISYGYGGHRWAATFPTYPTTRVTFRVNPGGVAHAQAAIDAAAATWNNAGADFRFIDGGTDNIDPSTTLYDGHNDIGWASGLADGVIAQASFTYFNGYLSECNVEYSTAFAWGDGSGYTMDIQSIGTHEIGHWLNLRDLYGDADSPHVMYGFSSEGIVKRSLTAGDKAGILWIYGPAPAPTPDPTPTPTPDPTPTVVDTIAPVTTSDAATAYSGSATITFHATDAGGSGVATTYYSLDGGTAVAGGSVSVSVAGTHTLDFWSVDGAGNLEAPHEIVFTIAAPLRIVQSLTTPSAPSSVRHRATFTVTGYVKPRVAVGASVTLRFYRYESGHWKLRKTVTAHATNYSTYSKYSVKTTVPYTGKWRVRAYRAVTVGASYSSYRNFTAK